MKKPEIPENEGTRLETLRSLDILDTSPEERFDRLTRIAKRLFNVPIALVSLIDENRQWFKSSQGLETRETPRDQSFCGHAIHDEEIMIVSDATRDDRFFDNPLVTGEPNIRFYAGYPIGSLDGDKLGTLCIIDSKPRELSKEDLDIFRDLAIMAQSELMAVQLAILDELTEISNRRGFIALAKHSLSLCKRQGIQALVIFIDLNKFKDINDELGHAEGDRVLKVFAEQMNSVFRDSDVYARLGGDEFVVLLTRTSKKHAEEILTRFQDNLEELNRTAGCEYKISFSYGMVEYDPDKHHSIEELLAEADSVMYKNKNLTN